MTPQQRQRLEKLVAKSGGDGRRHVTIPIDTLAELLGVTTEAPSEPTTPAASPDPVAVDPPALESPAPQSRRRKPKT